jgi:hypothetical protein
MVSAAPGGKRFGTVKEHSFGGAGTERDDSTTWRRGVDLHLAALAAWKSKDTLSSVDT